MAIRQIQQDNLYQAFGLFIEGFRPYIVATLMHKEGERWPALFAEALSPVQRDFWNQSLRTGSSPLGLIDYPHLKGFALRFKDLLRDDFGKEVNNLPSYLENIYNIRNKIAHYQDVSKDEFTEAFLLMRKIARLLRMNELEEALSRLEEAATEEGLKPAAAKPPVHMSASGVPAWFFVTVPHLDIKEGRLDESVFAANLSEVALGKGREVYANPVLFFSKTYLTAGLRSIAKRVIQGLNGKADAENRVVSLQTGFGGGKTHTLISLYHLAGWGAKAATSHHTKELFAYAGLPEFERANIAVFTNMTNDPANGRTVEDGSICIQTIWGELAYQLGGRAAYEIIRKNDEALIAPAGLFKRVLERCQPALILIDELADYCVKASARKAGNSSLADQTISFMQELTEAVAGTSRCVAVITLPASVQEVANTPEAQAILNSLQKRIGRMSADSQPVADEEIYEVIRRRLFEDAGDSAVIEDIATQYMHLYESHKSELPPHATLSVYKQKLIKSYPFHPELIDTFRVRWGSHHDFQRTRGVLRLLAAIVSDLWKRRQSLPGTQALIHAGLVNFANLDALSGQLKRLYGNGYDAVISADVSGASSNAFKIDSTKSEYGQWNLTQSVAATILLNSFGSEGPNKGISVQELKLNLLTPGSFNHNSINGALDELENHAYYLYYAQSSATGKRYWFYTKPNINILINQAKADISIQEINAEIVKRLQERAKNVRVFNTLVYTSNEIPEQLKPTLLILSPVHAGRPDGIGGETLRLIEKIATKKGNSERIYRNTILFLLCSEPILGELQRHVREYLACRKISAEYQDQLETEQKQDLRKRQEDASNYTEKSLAAAYSLVVKYTAKNGAHVVPILNPKPSLDVQIDQSVREALKAEELYLEQVGLHTLRTNGLLPAPAMPIRAKDVYEAFLRFDDKPMIADAQAVAQSLQRYCLNGEFCIASSSDGKTFTRYYLQEIVPYFDVTDASYWLTDKSEKPVPQSNYPEASTAATAANEPSTNGGSASASAPAQPTVKTFKTLTVSGKVPLEQYTQVFNSFIMPLAKNNIEIEVKIKAKSTSAKPLTESSEEYKIVKESARQLGLNLDEEV